MIDDYPDSLAFITIHDGDSYEVPWGTTRDAFYGALWTPFSCHDGLEDGWPINEYEAKFLARRAIPTDVTIDMMVFGSGANFDVSATVCIEPTGAGKDLKIWMAQVVDHYGPVNFDRNMVQDGSAGQEITLAAGECAVLIETARVAKAGYTLPGGEAATTVLAGDFIRAPHGLRQHRALTQVR